MKRSLKNIIMITIVMLVGIGSYFTMKSVNNNEDSIKQMPMQQGQPQMEQSDKNQPPQKPDENNDNKTENSNMNENTPPEKPSQDNQNTPPQMPNNKNENQLQVIHYALFAVEGLIISILIIYLVISKFNKLTFSEALKQKLIFIIMVLILTAVLTVAQVMLTKQVFLSNKQAGPDNMQMKPGEDMNSSSASVTQTGATTIEETKTLDQSEYTTSNNDESVILVENGGNATINGTTITKTGGDSSNTENSEFYGVNSGILVTKNSTATIKNATISTNAKGSNAVFSTGTDSKIYINDSTITTTGNSSSRGLDATYGGYIEANNVTISTQGGSCATLATDRGEGTVIAKNSKLETNGSGSPVIYSTGDISIENTQGTANGSQMVVIEGKNSATVTNSTLTASGKGNRGDTDQAGVMIYQSMSGDAGEGTGTFTATNSNLSVQENSSYYKTAPMFFITNTDAIINLNNCEMSYGSNILISSKGTNEWGKTGSNGGNLTFNAKDQKLEGNIEVDNISTLKMNFTGSSYTGKINSENTAKQIDLKLDSSTTITLTGDSYVTSLEDDDQSYSNINLNGYKLYVNGTAITK